MSLELSDNTTSINAIINCLKIVFTFCHAGRDPASRNRLDGAKASDPGLRRNDGCRINYETVNILCVPGQYRKESQSELFLHLVKNDLLYVQGILFPIKSKSYKKSKGMRSYAGIGALLFKGRNYGL